MAEQSDILGTLKGSLGLAGKLAGKGFNEVSGLIKGDDTGHKGQSGVYWQRGPWSNNSDLIPEIDYMESQELGRFKVSIVKRVTSSKAERAFTLACGCCVAADKQGLETNAREAVESDPQCTDGYFLLGCFYLEDHRAEAAAANFQKALLCQQGLGARFKKYLPSFRMIMPLTPSSAIALYPDLLGVNVLLALSQRQMGQKEAALSTMQQLLGVMPTEPLALFFMSILRLESGQFSQVVEDLSDVLPGSTLQVANLLLLGYACSRLGEVSTARDIYRSALEKSDYDPLMRLDLQYAQNTAMGASVDANAAIYSDCPSYQPFFSRLGLRLEGAAKGADGHNSQEAAAPVQSAADNSGNAGKAALSLPTAALAPALLTPSPSSAIPAAAAEKTSSAQPLPFVTASPGSAELSGTAGQEMTSGQPERANAAKTDNQNNASGDHASAPSGTALTAPDGTTIGIPKPVHVVDPLPPKIDGKVRLVCAERNMEIELTQTALTVGREEGECQLPFDGAVSRAHARLLWDNGRYLIEDLHSTNGTWLNGYRLSGGSRYEVNRGDVLQFGQTKFRMV
ncbi:MAG: FHA domain-containing protein [bacterium]|nr:FHA domain-containing protein [bacterium]